VLNKQKLELKAVGPILFSSDNTVSKNLNHKQMLDKRKAY